MKHPVNNSLQVVRRLNLRGKRTYRRMIRKDMAAEAQCLKLVQAKYASKISGTRHLPLALVMEDELVEIPAANSC